MTLHGTPSLYALVREALANCGGSCTRQKLLAKIVADPTALKRLEASQGFNSLLKNMKFSGFISLDGELVRATKRRVGQRHL